jgi:MarR family transcriptional regulator, organic hydroperoxide resistance regulator
MLTTMEAESKQEPVEAAEQDTGAGVEELAQAADALFYAMRRGRAAAGQSNSGLSPAQLALIGPLEEEHELAVSQLASGAAVSVPTATRMLQQLQASGLVSRRRSPADERQVLVSLTDDGRRELTAVRARLRERQTRGLSQFTPAERAQLSRQLRRLAEVITEQGL